MDAGIDGVFFLTMSSTVSFVSWQVGFSAYSMSRREAVDADRAAVELLDDRLQEPSVHDIEALPVDLEQVERAASNSLLKKAADKDDCADMVVAMCRTETMTGQTVVIDSGRIFH